MPVNNTIETKYQEATEFLFQQLPMFSRIGAPAYKPGLETSLALDDFFQNPHKKFKSIHIGGTNGKGSTSHLIASVLQEQGYKVGLYTSPHLTDFRERIKINGEMIPKGKVVEFVDEWKNCNYQGHPSFFELTMIMAFDWFAKQKVDYAVVEVGMGGRLDSTNIITPILSVITNISHDHNQFLGSTLEQIAGEKAGIIKKNVPIVIGERNDETDDVFIEKAKEVGTNIEFAPDYLQYQIFRNQDGLWKVEGKEISCLMPLQGEYQKKNIATALKALEKLREIGVTIDDSSLSHGIENVVPNTGLRGRWTILSQKPLTITDTGHNIAGITEVVGQLNHLMKNRDGAKLRIVIGFVADKAIDKILKILPREAEYYVTNASIPRALNADSLLKIFQDNGFSATKYPDVSSAYDKAKKDASEKDIIFIGGSTFIVADLLKDL